MSSFGKFSDEIIQRAMENGAFDNLPGKGKPLKLEDNPYEPAEWRTVYRVLRSNGYSLPWLELRNEIEEAIETMRSNAFNAWQSGRQDLWEAQVELLRSRVEALNRRIFQYNLQTPSAHFHRQPLDLAREINRIQQSDPSTTSTPSGGS